MIPTIFPTSTSHLSILQKDKQLYSAEWEVGRKLLWFMPEPFRMEHLWEKLEPGPPWNFPFYLPQKLSDNFSCSKHQSYIFLEAAAYSRKQVIWRLHYFYDEKRALEVNTHAYINMHNHILNLVFSLGRGKEISCGFSFQCTSII